MTQDQTGKFSAGPPFEGFDFVPHTADIAVRVRARTEEAVFAVAAAAFTEALTERRAVLGTAMRRVELAGAELDLLLVDWLEELLFLFETEGFLVREASVAITGGAPAMTDGLTKATKEEPKGLATDLRGDRGEYVIRATLHGETRDPSRHPLKLLIKAVTYHGLHITRTDGGYEATVIFDI